MATDDLKAIADHIQDEWQRRQMRYLGSFSATYADRPTVAGVAAEKVARLRASLAKAEAERERLAAHATESMRLRLGAEDRASTAEAQAAAMRAALAPLLKDYCELHDNETKHELFTEPAERALSLDAGRELAEEVRDLRARLDTGICSWDAAHGDKAHKCPHVKDATARAEKAEAEVELARQALAAFQSSADLRHDADRRAIVRWSEAHPDRPLTWPDHADLVVWLVERSAIDEGARDHLADANNGLVLELRRLQGCCADLEAVNAHRQEHAARLRDERDAAAVRAEKAERDLAAERERGRMRHGALVGALCRIAAFDSHEGDIARTALRAPAQEPREWLHRQVEKATAGDCACTGDSPCAAHALDPTLPEPCWACGKRREKCACQDACSSCGHPATEHDDEGCNHDLGPRRYANGNTTGEHAFCVCDAPQSGQAYTQDGVGTCATCANWGSPADYRMCSRYGHDTCDDIGDDPCPHWKGREDEPAVPGCVCGHQREMHDGWCAAINANGAECDCTEYQPAPAPGTRGEE